MEGSTIGDGANPIYSFNWDDGSSRRTDEGIEADDPSHSAIETLAELGREDPECSVELVGFQ